MLKEENYPHLENIAELLWLSKFTGMQSLVREEVKDEKNQEPNSKPEIEDDEVEDDEPNIESEQEEEQEDDLEVHTDNQEDNTSSSKQKSAKAIQSPKKLALDHYREWEKAFKFINLKTASKNRHELDEEKTVENIASTKVFDLVFKRVEEKSFFLTLVIDQGETMELWTELIKNFEQMLMTMGVFSRISIYYWDTRREKPILYVDKALKREASEKLVVIDGQRNLVWVMSDCIASSWKSGEAFKSIDRWATKSFTSILQMFPKEMWMGTMLFKGKHIRLSSNSFNPINKKLKVKPSKREKEVLKIPVISFDPYALQAWAKVVVNSKDNSISGIELDNLDFEPLKIPLKKEITSEMRMQRFYSQASPTAQKLAFYMSVLPVDFQVTRILQEEKLSKSKQSHVAEVFLGGLIERTTKNKRVSYKFYPNIREELNANISADKSFEIMADMSNFVSSHLGIGFDFKALLADPNGAFEGDFSLHDESLAYAKLASRVLKRKGGELYTIAKKIDTKVNDIEIESFSKDYEEQVIEKIIEEKLIPDVSEYNLYDKRWKDSSLYIRKIYSPENIKILNVYRNNDKFQLEINMYSLSQIIIDEMFDEQHMLKIKFLLDIEFNEFGKLISLNLKEVKKVIILDEDFQDESYEKRNKYEKIILENLKNSGWNIDNINKDNSANNIIRYESGIILQHKYEEIMYIEIEDNPTSQIVYAKHFAKEKNIPFVYASDSSKIYEYSFETQKGKFIEKYPSPSELYIRYKREIFLYKEDDLNVDLKLIVNYLNEICSYLTFKVGEEYFDLKDDVVNWSESYDELNPYIHEEIKDSVGSFFFTKKSYNNNYFFEGNTGYPNLMIVSFSGWSSLSSLPYSNAIAYFVAEILSLDLSSNQHQENTGCLYDFLSTKSNIDKNMRKAYICDSCYNEIEDNKTDSNMKILADIERILKVVSEASTNDLDILDKEHELKETIILSDNPTYWHLQLHPYDSSYTVEQVKEILSQKLIGLDFGENDSYHENSSLENWYKDTEDRKKYFLDIKDSDVILIRHGAKPIALVKAISNYKYVESPTAPIWFKHQIEVEVLSYYDEYIKTDSVKKFSMPQTRGTLWKSKNPTTDTYRIIDEWYKIIQTKFITGVKKNELLERVDIISLLATKSEEYELLAQAQDISFIYHFNVPSFRIKINFLLFIEIFHALIQNAFDATSQKGLISIQSRIGNKYFIIEIIDEGINIERRKDVYPSNSIGLEINFKNREDRSGVITSISFLLSKFLLSE